MSAVGGPIYFNAVLRPNTPMSLQARRRIVAAVAAMNTIFAGFFVLRGAWPVTPFMGTDVFLLAWALYTSGNAAKCREEVRLTGSVLRVDYFPACGEPTHIELNPYWVRVGVDEVDESRGAISLATQGRLLRIGSFLSPRERLSLANALSFALERARQDA
jgi:uncharacterized membrane protein